MKTITLIIIFCVLIGFFLPGCKVITLSGDLTIHIEEESVGEIIGYLSADIDGDGIYTIGLDNVTVSLFGAESGSIDLWWLLRNPTYTVKSVFGIFSFHDIPVGTYELGVAYKIIPTDDPYLGYEVVTVTKDNITDVGEIQLTLLY